LSGFERWRFYYGKKYTRKNKAHFKNNYLADKLQTIDKEEQKEKSTGPPAGQHARPNHSPATFLPRATLAEPILPMDIIVTLMGKRMDINKVIRL
jgi:hypothetical protein